MSSSHECPVIKIKMERLQDTEKLSKVMVGGYQLIVKTEDWKEGELAVHLPPDSIAPDSEQFEFLGEHKRIKIRRFCGYISEGLLVKAPDSAKEGDDCAELMGITHYEPEINYSTTGDNISGPTLITPKYDVENFKGKSKDIYHNSLITKDDEIIATEKLHGSNARFLFHRGQMWCGSRSNWKKDVYNNLWWNALRQNPWIEGWCCHHEDMVLYGEVFGQVQNLKYGTKPGEIRFAIFDILIQSKEQNSMWLNYDEAKKISPGCIWVPEVYRGSLDLMEIERINNENSTINGSNHYKEGVVIQPVINRYHEKVGRIKFKIISNRYLEKS